MGTLSDLFGKEASRRASKTAADAVWSQKDGTSAYSLIGKILVGCGAAWILISLVPIACKTSVSDCMWMWIIAAIQIVSGIVLVRLSKKSERFQKWANREFKKALNEKRKLEEKVKIGKAVLPMTHGDVLALKILGFIILIIIVILRIGYLQGWVA